MVISYLYNIQCTLSLRNLGFYLSLIFLLYHQINVIETKRNSARTHCKNVLFPAGVEGVIVLKKHQVPS